MPMRLSTRQFVDFTAKVEASERLVNTSVFDVAGWLIHADVQLALEQKSAAKRAFERALTEYDRTELKNAPKDRITQVRAALKKGTLAPVDSRSKTSTRRPALVRPRPDTAGVSAPPLRPQPRSHPGSLDLGV